MRTDNPVRGVRKFAENKREHRLSDEEYAALGAGQRQASETIWPPAVAALRLLALTSWRSGDAVCACGFCGFTCRAASLTFEKLLSLLREAELLYRRMHLEAKVAEAVADPLPPPRRLNPKSAR